MIYVKMNYSDSGNRASQHHTSNLTKTQQQNNVMTAYLTSISVSTWGLKAAQMKCRWATLEDFLDLCIFSGCRRFEATRTTHNHSWSLKSLWCFLDFLPFPKTHSHLHSCETTPRGLLSVSALDSVRCFSSMHHQHQRRHQYGGR